jgi:hypothetical protein
VSLATHRGVFLPPGWYEHPLTLQVIDPDGRRYERIGNQLVKVAVVRKRVKQIARIAARRFARGMKDRVWGYIARHPR